MTWQLRKISLKNAAGVESYYCSIALPVWIQGSIIDIETRGRDPDYFNMTGLGIVRGNRLSAFVITTESEKRADHCREFRQWAIRKVQRCPRPFAAYYFDFEERWLETSFDIELQPWDRQKKMHACTLSHIENTSNKAMLEAPAEEIMYHLVADLLEELALYVSLSHQYRAWVFKLEYLDDWFEEQEKLQQQKKEVNQRV